MVKLNTIRKTLYLYVNIPKYGMEWRNVSILDLQIKSTISINSKGYYLILTLQMLDHALRHEMIGTSISFFPLLRNKHEFPAVFKKITPTSLRYFGTHFFIFNLSLTTKQLYMIFYWHFLSPFFFYSFELK